MVEVPSGGVAEIPLEIFVVIPHHAGPLGARTPPKVRVVPHAHAVVRVGSVVLPVTENMNFRDNFEKSSTWWLQNSLLSNF